MKSRNSPGAVVISGRIRIGLGRGKYFMGQAGYKKQFIKKLGIDPYHGTLNLKLSGLNLRKLHKIREGKAKLISGFKKGKKTFGDVLGYSADVEGIKCALIVPKMSTHTDVAEIISSEKLREVLKLKEGSAVKVTVRS